MQPLVRKQHNTGYKHKVSKGLKRIRQLGYVEARAGLRQQQQLQNDNTMRDSMLQQDESGGLEQYSFNKTNPRPSCSLVSVLQHLVKSLDTVCRSVWLNSGYEHEKST